MLSEQSLATQGFIDLSLDSTAKKPGYGFQDKAVFCSVTDYTFMSQKAQFGLLLLTKNKIQTMESSLLIIE